MGSLKLSKVLGAVSDDTSIDLFKLVALTNGNSETLRSNMNITRKQYYSRLHRLVQCGLVRRRDGNYSLTTLGRILFEAQATIESALSNYWRIKAVDSLEVDDGIPLEEQKSMMESLIKDQGLKNILANSSLAHSH